MSEYAFADIITGKDILTDQVEDKDIIGAKGYFASDLKTIVDSFDDNTFPDSLLEGTVETVSYVGRFKRKEDGIYFDYFIRKKEPEKKYVPFDLSKEEDRDALRGKWVRDSRWGHEWMVEGFFIDEATGAGYKAKLSRKKAGFNGEQLLERYVFLNGSPVGKSANGQQISKYMYLLELALKMADSDDSQQTNWRNDDQGDERRKMAGSEANRQGNS